VKGWRSYVVEKVDAIDMIPLLAVSRALDWVWKTVM
jgi:hypothetical protein